MNFFFSCTYDNARTHTSNIMKRTRGVSVFYLRFICVTDVLRCCRKRFIPPLHYIETEFHFAWCEVGWAGAAGVGIPPAGPGGSGGIRDDLAGPVYEDVAIPITLTGNSLLRRHYLHLIARHSSGSKRFLSSIGSELWYSCLILLFCFRDFR